MTYRYMSHPSNCYRTLWANVKRDAADWFKEFTYTWTAKRPGQPDSSGVSTVWCHNETVFHELVAHWNIMGKSMPSTLSWSYGPGTLV